MSTPNLDDLAHKIAEIESAVNDRAGDDAAFRAELLADPHTVLAREAGLPVGSLDAYEIDIHTSPSGTLSIILSDAVSTEQLTDADLEAIADNDEESGTTARYPRKGAAAKELSEAELGTVAGGTESAPGLDVPANKTASKYL